MLPPPKGSHYSHFYHHRLPVFELYINGLIQYDLLCLISLIKHNIWRFTHDLACSRSLLFSIAITYSIEWIYHSLFIHSFAGHLRSFQVWGYESSFHEYFCGRYKHLFFVGYIPRTGIAGLLRHVVSFLRYCLTVLQNDCGLGVLGTQQLEGLALTPLQPSLPETESWATSSISNHSRERGSRWVSVRAFLLGGWRAGWAQQRLGCLAFSPPMISALRGN